MKTPYTEAEVEAYARAKDIDIKTSLAAHEAGVRYDELVHECQAAHPDLHPTQCDVMVLETDEGRLLYAAMNPRPTKATKALRARVVLLEQARQALSKITRRDVLDEMTDSSIVNLVL